MGRILDDKCGFLQSVWFQISPKSLKSYNLKIQCIHLKHPVKYMIHIYTYILYTTRVSWLPDDSHLRSFSQNVKTKTAWRALNSFLLLFPGRRSRSVLRTLRALRLVAFPGEKPNETFSRCSSNNLHTWFPTKVGNKIF